VLEYDGSTGAILNWYSYSLGSNDVLNQLNVPGGTRSTLVPDLRGDQEARNDEEDIDAEIAARQPGKSGVKAKHRGDRNRPQAVDVVRSRRIVR
jgi:hypothetical protein